MSNAKRRCKNCKKYAMDYIVINLSAFCNTECAIAYSREPKAQEEAYKERTRKLKQTFEQTDLRTWRNRARKACHDFIKYRDRADGCISCGKTNATWHAGHFIPDGRNSQLRYHPQNIHKQCAQCNLYNGGNLTAYEEALRVKIGNKAVDWLKAQGTARRWTVDELKLITHWYKTKLKTLKTEVNTHG